MIFYVSPAKKLTGVVHLPASKSYTIRAFIVASYGGRSRIIYPSQCEDALVAVRTAEALGAKISREKEDANIFRVEARSRKRKLKIIDVNESGTVLRLLLPLVCWKQMKVNIVGQGTLRGRPNHHLITSLRKMGADIKGTGEKESIPIRVGGGWFSGGPIYIDGSMSSQYVSAWLITCPQMEHDSCLIVRGKNLVSLDYITMTREVLKQAGVRISQRGQRQFFIKGKQSFKGLKNFFVPSDFGLAAFLMAAACLVGSNVSLRGHLNRSLIQADGHIIKFLRQMGAKFELTGKSIRINGPFNLKGGTFSLKDCPDLVPIMTILALFAKGKTKLRQIRHARTKESDRISDLRMELLRIGANVKEKPGELIIIPKNEYKSNCTFDPHKDHRLAMAFSVLGLKIGARIRGIECTRKSYPQFVRDFRALGARTKKA